MPDFVAFQSSDPLKQLEEVADKAEELYARLPTNAPAPDKDSACLYTRWQQEKSTTEQNWFEKKVELESAFTQALNTYVEIEQERANLAAELSPLTEQIKTLGKQREYQAGLLARLKQRVEFTKSNYRMRVASVPWSMVVIGKVPIKQREKIEDLKATMDRQMRLVAGKALIPGRIQGFTELSSSALVRQWIQDTHSSRSAIIDSYDQESQKFIDSQLTLIQLHRIEARPAWESTRTSPSEASPLAKTLAGLEIFAYQNGELRQLSPVPREYTSSFLQEPTLDAKEMAYLKDREEAANTVNESGRRFVEKWETEYQREQYELGKKQLVVEKRLAELKNDLERRETELNDKREQLRKYQQDSEDRKSEADKARQQYEDHYRKRVILQNRLVSAMAPTRGTIEDRIRMLAKDTWPSEEQRSGTDTSQVLVGQAIGGQGETVDVNFSMSSIQYRAKVRAFKILYLALGERGSPLYVLNVAYEIEQTEGPRVEVDRTKRTLELEIAKNRKVTWHWYQTGSTSLNAAGRRALGGFVLPTVEQLRILAQYLKRNGEQSLTDLGFDLSHPFVSQDQTMMGKFRCLNLRDENEPKSGCDTTDEVNLLWIRE